jgi:hypothetical protein
MAVTLDRRTLSEEERQGLASPLWSLLLKGIPGLLGRYVLFFLLAMLLMMVVSGVIDAAVRKLSSGSTNLMQQQARPDWFWILVLGIWGPVIVIPGYLAYRGFRPQVRRHRSRRADLLANEAWVVRIVDAPFVEFVDDCDARLFLFDLGDGRSLLVDDGRIAWNFALFGLPEPDEAPDEDADGNEDLDRPSIRTPFPNSDFVMHLLPTSGRILRIEARGEPVAPSRVLAQDAPALPEAARLLADPDRDALLIERDLGLFGPHQSVGL